MHSKLHHFILIVIHLSNNEANSQCPSEFKSRCHCGVIPYGQDKRETFVTNCTNTNFTDALMLTQLPIETEVLIFTGNNVSSLPANLLGQDAKYEKLHTIDLSNNSISFIKGKTFHNVRSVKILNLNHNNIIIDEDNFHPRLFSNFIDLNELHLEDAFENKKHAQDIDFMRDLADTFAQSALQNIKVLNLANNSFTEFPSSVTFCFLPKMQKLYLNNNLMTDFKLNLTCLSDLTLIDISSNRIISLHNSSFKYLETGRRFYQLNLTDNPFHCDCHLKPFLTWMVKTEIKLLDIAHYQCDSGFPYYIAGRFLDEIDSNNLACSNILNDDMSPNYYISFSYAILSALLVTLVVLIGALLYTNKGQITNAWRHIAAGISFKREYTSLEKKNKRQKQVNTEVAEAEV